MLRYKHPLPVGEPFPILVLLLIFSDKFIEILRQQPRSTSVSSPLLSSCEITIVRTAGFLVSSGISRKSSVPNVAGSGAARAIISRQLSGTMAAAGGEAALDSLGGAMSTQSPSSDSVTHGLCAEFNLSLPNMGAYLRLLNDARAHFMSLLGKSKYKEAPLYLLRERWDGAIESDNSISSAKRIRGEYAGVLPGKTKKWKEFYGMRFEWALEECLGAGYVELFETNSVGNGIRVV